MSNIDKAVRKNQDGAIIDLIVTTGANENLFPAGYNQWRKRIEIRVTSPPIDNKANFDIIQTCADFFKISVNNVWIVSGKNNKEKSILLCKVSNNAAVRLIKESLNGL